MSGTHSLDLRERVIEAWRQGKGKSVIARRFMLGYATVRRYIARFEASESVHARPHGGGAPRKVDATGEALLRQLVNEHPDATDEELARQYSQRAEDSISHATVNRVLHRMGLTRKNVTARRGGRQRGRRNADLEVRAGHAPGGGRRAGRGG
ncbi:helix-turn-helix domain-containing protein [Corallococcus carmarthensis]|uniref:helix-turn-helix domain-containing protein n=1 Tax=Corallococcus carmarthensis TaxID=2316728 RepID=UPI00148B6150|nr:helix-turn-helix domain-containing protein [Corallococcus carmarthensis]NOK23938.1 transposase [Corallococcus carmarthensis]